MKKISSVLTTTTVAGLCGAVILTASCTQQAPPAAAAPAAPTPEVSRYQVVVAPDGDRGSILFLVDSVGGQSWIYRPPQGTAINGFWSDIPRLTYSPDYWQRVFTAPPPGATQIPSVTQTGAAPPSAIKPPS